jgi:hypothetical protein
LGGEGKCLTEDTELFVSLAQIAGVFIGFGALIGFTRRPDVAAVDRFRINTVVLVGLLVVAAALIPICLTRYSLEPATVWRVSSFVFLILIWVVILAPFRDASDRSLLFLQARAEPMALVFLLCLEILVQGPLVCVLLGLFPTASAALYTTALVINLLQVSFMLSQLVLSRPATHA